MASKTKWKIHACFSGCFKFRKYFLQKIARYRSSFISCRLTSVFTSVDKYFYNFPELDSKLSKKMFSPQIFLFQRIHPTPLTPKISYVWWKFSVDASLVNVLLHHKHRGLPSSLWFWRKLGSYFQQGHQPCLHIQW